MSSPDSNSNLSEVLSWLLAAVLGRGSVGASTAPSGSFSESEEAMTVEA
jgi:hypothetical protein